MLSQRDVVNTFDEVMSEHLPQELTFRVVGRDEYVATLAEHEYIKYQIECGIYTEDSLASECLSPVMSFVDMQEVWICYDLMADYMMGVDDGLSMAYIRATAMHETYHFLHPGSGEDVDQEIAANSWVWVMNPSLWDDSQEFERQSPVFQRVYARMRDEG